MFEQIEYKAILLENKRDSLTFPRMEIANKLDVTFSSVFAQIQKTQLVCAGY